jgi:hypothetical protein
MADNSDAASFNDSECDLFGEEQDNDQDNNNDNDNDMDDDFQDPYSSLLNKAAAYRRQKSSDTGRSGAQSRGAGTGSFSSQAHISDEEDQDQPFQDILVPSPRRHRPAGRQSNSRAGTKVDRAFTIPIVCSPVLENEQKNSWRSVSKGMAKRLLVAEMCVLH